MTYLRASRWLPALILLTMVVTSSAFLVACGANRESQTVRSTLPEGWKRHQSTRHGYSVVYPADWEIEAIEKGASGGITQFYEPKTGVSFAVAVGPTRETNVKDYVDANKVSLKEGATYLREGPIIINGRQGYELVLTLPSQFFGRAFKPGNLKNRQIAFLVQGKVYVVTTTALQDEYPNYNELFEKVMNSFIVPNQ